MAKDKERINKDASPGASGSSLANIQDMLVRLLEFSIQPMLIADASEKTVLFANRAFSMWCGLYPVTGSPLADILGEGGTAAMTRQWEAMLKADRAAPRRLLDASMTSVEVAEKEAGVLHPECWHNGLVFGNGPESAAMRVAFVSSYLELAVVLIRPHNSWLMHLPNFSHLDSALMNFPGVITYADAQDRYHVFNRELEHVTGLDETDIRGKTPRQVLPEELAGQLETITGEMHREGRRITADVKWSKDGKPVWHRVIQEPVFDRESRHMGTFSIATDISDRYAMENALFARERLMRAISRSAQLLLSSEPDDFQKTVDSVLEVLGQSTDTDRVDVWSFYPEKADGGALYASQLYSWASTEQYAASGRAVRQRNMARDEPEWLAALREGRSVQRLVRDMEGATRADLLRMEIVSILLIPIHIQGELWGFIGFDDCREERHWADSEVSVLTAAGNLISMATENYYTAEKLRTANQRLHNSLTNANRLAAEAKQADQLKSAFLANISHEIRTPMNAIMGMARLAMEELPPGRQRKYLHQIETAGQTLLKLFEDILDVSQVESGEMALEKTGFNLDDCMQAVSETMMPRARQAGLGLTFDLAQEVPRALCGDADRLIQILTNLVDNAIKFTRTGYINVKIRLQSRTADHVILQFDVIDTGIGIPVERRQDIFAAFSQADGSYTRKYGGTGLGLAISASLVNMMDGEIWCEDNPNGGSVFTFTAHFDLPVRRHPQSPEAQQRDDFSRGGAAMVPAQLDLRQLRGARALVVEDNEINQMIISSLLEEVGMEITLAGNGLEALDKLNQSGFDVVLMDIQMPEMDGLTATAHIRADGRFDGLPILAITAHATPSDYQKSVAAGMNGHVTKPVEPAVLYTELTRWVAEEKHPF